MINLVAVLSLMFLIVSSSSEAQLVASHQYKKNSISLTSEDCLGCHQIQANKWQKSDHFMSMAKPSSNLVFGDFNNATALHYNQKAVMFTEQLKGEKYYKVTVFDDASNPVLEGETFTVKFTFGHYPLQQYLVETETGRMQVMPFAWDSRKIEEGGQRWYHLYSQEAINANDRLHWRQPLQNWNGMCADCHSDELTRSYDLSSNTFDTQFTGVNVGCVSCHGLMDRHIANGQYLPDSKAESHDMTHDLSSGAWKLHSQDKTATWVGKKRNNDFMDTCFACHALRTPLTDGFKAGEKFLDLFSPTLVIDPVYHADGQIKEEAYVYGSFLQSKMFGKGVNCLDCHDPHTLKVKIKGNGLCLQCHKAAEFDTSKHHHHKVGSTGAQCINCHMPEASFMGVDKRRDHSFQIPKPHISDTYKTPNACVACHKNSTSNWASIKLAAWFGTPEPLTSNQQNLLKLRGWQRISLQAAINIVKDTTMDMISRASALQMLPRTTSAIKPEELAEFVNHKSGQLRLASAHAAILITPSQRGALLAPLLRDELRAIRVAAAQALVGVPLNKEDLNAYSASFEELMNSHKVSAWRGEGISNLGSIAIAENKLAVAKSAFKNAINIDPYFTGGYINLADIFRAELREGLVEMTLADGIKNNPTSAEMRYAYGLHLVRAKNIIKAVPQLKKAMELDPLDSQLAYTYILALDSSNKSKQALDELKELIGSYQRSTSLKELGLYLAQKNKSREAYEYFLRF